MRMRTLVNGESGRALELGQSAFGTIRQGIMSFGEFYALRRAGKIP